jgi:hypothetical protein
MLSHQDEVQARAFFGQHTDEFEHWLRKDSRSDELFGIAEAAIVFVALCEAIRIVAGGMEDISKITKHAQNLIRYAKKMFGVDQDADTPPTLDVSDRVLILIFDHYMRSGTGITTERLGALIGAARNEIETAAEKFASNGIIRHGATGWVVEH